MKLCVNIDHIATLRQARRGRIPDPVEAASACERAGADSIVCHLREDRRHIQDADVRALKASVRRLNLEMSIAPEIVRAALAIKPAQVTLVPERRQELTTEGGLDAIRLSKRLTPLVRKFHAQGIEVSLFIDPATRQVKAARDTGARIIELHTGTYANASSRQQPKAREALSRAAAQGEALGLSVAAGHGLDYGNIGAILAIPQIDEVNIGFSIIARSVTVGLEQAVREMIEQLYQRNKAHALQAA